MMDNLVSTEFWSLAENSLPLASLMLTQGVPRSLTALDFELNNMFLGPEVIIELDKHIFITHNMRRSPSVN